jgi:iron complex transport system substrate-binding protein
MTVLELPEAIDPTRREFVKGALALSALGLAACGEDDPPGTRRLGHQDPRGRLRPPRQAPDRAQARDRLGMTPVAAAFPADISPDYAGGDLGRVENIVAEDGWTLNVERALALEPDLIVAVGADYNRENCDRYRKATTTFCFEEIYETGTDADIKRTLAGIAVAVGREDEAADAIAAYDRRVAAVRKRMDAAGRSGAKVGLMRIDATGWMGIRTGDAGNAVLKAVGLLAPDWPKPNADGYVELSQERLGLLDRADDMLVNADDNVDVDKIEVLDTGLWKRLDVVRGDRVHLVSAWNGGDLPQLHRMLDDIEQTFL